MRPLSGGLSSRSSRLYRWFPPARVQFPLQTRLKSSPPSPLGSRDTLSLSLALSPSLRAPTLSLPRSSLRRRRQLFNIPGLTRVQELAFALLMVRALRAMDAVLLLEAALHTTTSDAARRGGVRNMRGSF